ncbi:GL24274 [Drosophila persimilis]|uniref:GL24274 n=1 Tax=Drosophila persimilis TaxID=7234 RepID=B4G514_DROPE|nr:protein sel-1 homolog 1 [Drosophila persimilis]XP_026840575.1 protein sel-1 homolog 1 [Drosophila persimilis]XP_026840576.1 protein sel-1 homolog 1 [Drosophila persimilis]XP_026840577.1 protein sel-1 homolog 1 [Drosophila persimilis]EDW24680.1 GL24274 [Drosophila persimilis]
MKLASWMCLLMLLLAKRGQLLRAELQGPTATTETTGPSAPTATSLQSGEPSSQADTEEVTTAETDSRAPAVSNERKASKPKDGTEFMPRVNPAVLFERLWNDSLMKQQKLKAEIEKIEASRQGTVETVAELTPEQLEAQLMYNQAIDMLAKPRTDKRVVFTLLKKAAAFNHREARAALAWAVLMGHWMEFDFHHAADEFESLANEGLPSAHMGLAFMYSAGVGGKNVSQPLALIHYTLAALGDDTLAQMALGYRYLYGINVPISCEKALIQYKRVAKKVASKVTFANGPVVHRVRLLDELENPGSHETEIVDYYQLLADKGDVQSQVGLGQLYYQGGKAIEQDHQKALEYFTLAANAGNAIGFAFLGKLYLEGSEQIKADNETAFKYFSKASETGDPVGLSGLGVMYLKGLGVPKDPVKALSYFTQAADQGWVDGQVQLGTMYFTGNGVKTDYGLALKYFNLATQSGHVLAYYNLGVMHAYGMGVLRSCPTAVEFFKSVSERGRWSNRLMHAYSDYKQNRIDEAYMQYSLMGEVGYEVAQSNAAFLLDREEVHVFNDRHEDLIRAFYYWKRAAGQGYSAAQVKLGDYYYYGWGTSKDFETAAALYRKASEQQYNAQAMFNLGYMHEQGLGMKKDWHLAKRLYDLAAETNADAKVPVAIALLKLQVLAKIESIKESPYKFIFYLDENIAANWDLYTITLLTLLLGFIMYTRRPFQQPDQIAAAQQPAFDLAAAAPVQLVPPVVADVTAAAPAPAPAPAPEPDPSTASGTSKATATAVAAAATSNGNGATEAASSGASASANALDPTD